MGKSLFQVEHKKLGTWMGKKSKRKRMKQDKENNDGREEKNTDRLKCQEK